jgi:hypothetical protein
MMDVLTPVLYFGKKNSFTESIVCEGSSVVMQKSPAHPKI